MNSFGQSLMSSLVICTFGDALLLFVRIKLVAQWLYSWSHTSNSMICHVLTLKRHPNELLLILSFHQLSLFLFLSSVVVFLWWIKISIWHHLIPSPFTTPLLSHLLCSPITFEFYLFFLSTGTIRVQICSQVFCAFSVSLKVMA